MSFQGFARFNPTDDDMEAEFDNHIPEYMDQTESLTSEKLVDADFLNAIKLEDDFDDDDV
ncbi:hypothetical protein PROFUN_12382 [Planoprotostelium fungivorum]|uniref:Uncharacterized protein n=1 Tax=Planoprotostelium fungivorum TaxID=1890364 RepID=A0A2P6N7H1_9EUKA|nr:hypothetical protein PROFUN_12382 [Planoprotostelium fungivorum]